MKWCVCICKNKQCQYFVTQCWKDLEGNKQQNPWKGTDVIQCRSIDSMKLQVSRSFQVTICSRVFRECASAPGFRYSPFFSVLWKLIGWGGVYLLHGSTMHLKLLCDGVSLFSNTNGFCACFWHSESMSVNCFYPLSSASPEKLLALEPHDSPAPDFNHPVWTSSTPERLSKCCIMQTPKK